jgi:dihydroorotate dehydrogenase electron transfer subunit
VLGFRAPEIAAGVRPAQFVNVKVNALPVPLLRRPFSVYRVDGAVVEILFNVVGTGTDILAHARVGDALDVLGPLGHAYGLDDDYDTALLVGGGLGVAPMPITTIALERLGKHIRTYLGARSAPLLVTDHLVGVEVATDDGSAGFRGTVVDLLRGAVARGGLGRPKIFACGPNPMLRALATAAEELGIPCEVSLESAMACGIGLCQGCPVETRGGDKKYALICREGTVFDTRSIVIP